eukprot:9951177-Karenia_brevis.AAC.1
MASPVTSPAPKKLKGDDDITENPMTQEPPNLHALLSGFRDDIKKSIQDESQSTRRQIEDLKAEMPQLVRTE